MYVIKTTIYLKNIKAEAFRKNIPSSVQKWLGLGLGFLFFTDDGIFFRKASAVKFLK